MSVEDKWVDGFRRPAADQRQDLHVDETSLGGAGGTGGVGATWWRYLDTGDADQDLSLIHI